MAETLADDDRALVETIADAIRSAAPLPRIPRQFSLDEAYRLQHLISSRLYPQGTGAIKVGVATAPAQQALGVEHALLATLYDARHPSGCQLPHVDGRKLESEVAVRVDADGQPLGIAPAIEVVKVHYSRPADISAPNLLLSNLATNLYIVGDCLPWSAARDDLRMTLRRDGEEVNAASMDEAVGGPCSGLPWVWEEIRRRGFHTGEETLLMMGACGAVIPADAGDYVADYGDLGSLTFRIG